MGSSTSLLTKTETPTNKPSHSSPDLGQSKRLGWNVRARRNLRASLACNVHTDLEILAVTTFGLTQEGKACSQVSEIQISQSCP